MEASGELRSIEVVELEIQMTQDEFDLVRLALEHVSDPTPEEFGILQELRAVLAGVTLSVEE